MSKRCHISTRHSNSTVAIPDEETYESTPNIFSTSFFQETQQFFLPHFFGKPTNFPTSFSWKTHQFFLPHFFGKPTNFSFLIFMENPPIFPTSFSWETHNISYLIFWEPTNFSYLIFLGNPQFFLPHFFWETTNYSYLIFLGNPQFFLPHFFGKPTNFSYLIFLGNPPIFPTSFFWETHQFSYLIFLENPLIWLMKLLKKLYLMRFLATISVIIWNFCKLFTMKEGTIDTYKTTPPLLSYLIRVLRNWSLKIWSDTSQYLKRGVSLAKISRNLTGSGI